MEMFNGYNSEESLVDPSLIVEEISKEERGDILVRVFWTGGTDCIVDVRITNLDAPSYTNSLRNMDQILMGHEQEKNKYLQTCIQNRKSFMPFVCSVDGKLGNEAKKSESTYLFATHDEKDEHNYNKLDGICTEENPLACLSYQYLNVLPKGCNKNHFESDTTPFKTHFCVGAKSVLESGMYNLTGDYIT